ncbi:HTH-type transcriptional regulator YesS [compost metagenome]
MTLYSNFIWYPSEPLLRLTNAIKQGDAALAQEMLDQLKSMMTDKKLSLIMEKLICYEIVNTLLRTVNDLNLKLPNQEFNMLSAMGNWDDLVTSIGKLIQWVCETVYKNKKLHKDETIQQIITTIQQNYMEYDMSLEKIASEFNLSMYSLSKVFKEEMGVGFKDYLIQLRMKEAKRLLLQGNESVKEITQKMGYANVSHFIRSFKSIEGVTPAQYRQLGQQQPSK